MAALFAALSGILLGAPSNTLTLLPSLRHNSLKQEHWSIFLINVTSIMNPPVLKDLLFTLVHTFLSFMG